MENPNIDDTLPLPIDQDAHELSPNLKDTNPTHLKQESVSANTSPIQIKQETERGEDAPSKSGPGDQPAIEEGLPEVSGGGSGTGISPASSAGGMSWRVWAFIGVATLLLIAAISAYGGYRTGMEQRTSFGATQVALEVNGQYELAVQDIEAKHYDLARQRLEWVLSQDPSYPGAIEKLAEVLLAINTTATPVPSPTPTLTPTPDLRSVEELYTQSKQLLAAGDWSTAIDTLLKLRKEAPDYHTVEVDGLLYVALRSRGVEKIKNADLEGGTYDLALAERFGPLDVEASNWRDWAEWYITGASFWEVDWPQVINYFSQLVNIVPNLRDASGWTTSERYLDALKKYGDQLAASGDWCGAQEQYDLAQEYSSDPELQPTAAYAFEQCSAPSEEQPVETGTATPTPTPPAGEATPTVTQEGSTPASTEVTPEVTAPPTLEPSPLPTTPAP